MIEARVSDYMFMGGVAIQLIRKPGDGSRQILRFEGQARAWEEVQDQFVATGATLALDDDEARALLDALLRHYQGASDMHTVRADLLHERGRVDKAMDALIRIATEVPGGTHA